VTWNYRGYPPSGVPDDPAAYSQEHPVAGQALHHEQGLAGVGAESDVWFFAGALAWRRSGA